MTRTAPQYPDNQVLLDLKRAFREGEVSAAFVLGRLYDEGWGVRRNATLATKWYLAAAERGVSHAFYFVAARYLFGQGIKTNARAAFRWFERASAAGDVTAKYMIAVCVFDGRGKRKNANRGLALLRTAAAAGSSDAMDFLAAYHLEGGRLRSAKHWAIRAVRGGDALAPQRLTEIERFKATPRASPRLHPTPPRRSRAASRRG